jgi:hypothetical protein
VYIPCAQPPGLADGLYHFHPRELALRRLRAGGRAELVPRGRELGGSEDGRLSKMA